jgi:plasmid stability protein
VHTPARYIGNGRTILDGREMVFPTAISTGFNEPEKCSFVKRCILQYICIHRSRKMPLLQVRDIPDDLYESLARAAKMENRSIAQETIVLLRSALALKEERKSRRKRILEEIHNIHIENPDNLPDPADLVREDRSR